MHLDGRCGITAAGSCSWTSRCFVEAFKAIQDWSLSRLLLKAGIVPFLVYWITAWGKNSGGIWCYNPSGGFTWSLETPQSRFHHRHSNETKIFKACTYFQKHITLPSIGTLVFRNNGLSSDFTVKTDTNFTLELTPRNARLRLNVYSYKNLTTNAPSLTGHSTLSLLCAVFPMYFLI